MRMASIENAPAKRQAPKRRKAMSDPSIASTKAPQTAAMIVLPRVAWMIVMNVTRVRAKTFAAKTTRARRSASPPSRRMDSPTKELRSTATPHKSSIGQAGRERTWLHPGCDRVFRSFHSAGRDLHGTRPGSCCESCQCHRPGGKHRRRAESLLVIDRIRLTRNAATRSQTSPRNAPPGRRAPRGFPSRQCGPRAPSQFCRLCVPWQDDAR